MSTLITDRTITPRSQNFSKINLDDISPRNSLNFNDDTAKSTNSRKFMIPESPYSKYSRTIAYEVPRATIKMI